AEKISKTFFQVKRNIKINEDISKYLLEIKRNMQKKFNIKIEYLELRNEKNLLISKKTIGSKIFVSYYLKGIRLIDNF
ncbi:pantoate--beta-alanine ligase, partial [Candidatus Pelagibacter sp.]|nr:pantoate--beta-alanine ligase [Candidatus Pelagibacter sp.]